MGVGFDVWLMAFSPDVQDPQETLADAFGIDKRRARKLVDSLPKVVKRGVSQSAAQQYAGALRELGAKVEIRASVRTDAYPPATLPKTTSIDPSEGVEETGLPRPGRPSPGSTSQQTKRATLGDGPTGTRETKLGQIVGGGNAPYAWLTHSLMGWLMMVGGLGILALELWLRANAFAGVVDFLDVLVTWVGATLATSGLIEGVYGAAKRRSLHTRLPVAVLWLAALVGLQAMYGNPLLSRTFHEPAPAVAEG